MALLVYSDRCQYSADILTYIRTQPALLEIVRFHNVTELGVPSKKITRVPTLVTNEGKMYVGSEVRTWLEQMAPCEFDCWDASGGYCANLDGSDIPTLFELDMYGKPLQPVLTPELESKIGKNVNDAYQDRSGS
jgi:hypothetical protein